MWKKKWIITFFDYFCILMKNLSILIPTYNDPCADLVRVLQRQADLLDIDYEIIVADDGSTRQEVIEANRAINLLPHCRVEERKQNVGRAAIRNFLAQQAQYDWLLYLDCDLIVANDDFLYRYTKNSNCDVIDGGVAVNADEAKFKNNLRYCYELQASYHHTVQQRNQQAYRSFRTTNFVISRQVMLSIGFDERFHSYGYEDVFFGKKLEENSIDIMHIDNPTILSNFEMNEHYIRKVEESLRTLHQFRDELQGYSGLLSLANRLHPVAPLIRLWHSVNKKWERRLLTGPHPSLRLFQLYRLGYLMSL